MLNAQRTGINAIKILSRVRLQVYDHVCRRPCMGKAGAFVKKFRGKSTFGLITDNCDSVVQALNLRLSIVPRRASDGRHVIIMFISILPLTDAVFRRDKRTSGIKQRV